jgi:hypothetical protein
MARWLSAPTSPFGLPHTWSDTRQSTSAKHLDMPELLMLLAATGGSCYLHCEVGKPDGFSNRRCEEPAGHAKLLARLCSDCNTPAAMSRMHMRYSRT